MVLVKHHPLEFVAKVVSCGYDSYILTSLVASITASPRGYYPPLPCNVLVAAEQTLLLAMNELLP